MRLLSLGWSILFVSCLLAFFWSLQHLSHPCLSYIWHCLGGVAGLSVVAHPIVCECAPERNVMQSSMYMFLKGAHWNSKAGFAGRSGTLKWLPHHFLAHYQV